MGKNNRQRQHQVGERFARCGIIYEVRLSDDFQCEGCALLTDDGHCLDNNINAFEPCVSLLRDDEQDVIFAKVGKEGATSDDDEPTEKATEKATENNIIRDITANHFDEMLGGEPASEEMNNKQLQKLMHALGMDHKEPKDGVYEAYRRNSFYNEPDEIWESLRATGLAKRITRDDGKEFIYVVTDKGMQHVANATGLTIRFELEFTPK